MSVDPRTADTGVGSPLPRAQRWLQAAVSLQGVTVAKAVVTAFALLNLADVVRLAMEGGRPALVLVSQLTGYAVMAVLPWFTISAVVGLVPLLIALVQRGLGGVEPFLIAVTVVVLAASSPARYAVGGIGVVVAWVIAFTAITGELTFLWVMLLTVTVATACGAVVRTASRSQRQLQERYQRVVEENERIRSDERVRLARDLHDIVAHQLSVVSLQAMGHRDAESIDEVRKAMDRIQAASQAALGELTVLVGVLRDPAPGGMTPGELQNLSVGENPSETADTLVERLRENGFSVTADIDPVVDDLEMNLRRTVTRILREATTNALRYAPAGSLVIMRTAVGVSEVSVTVTSVACRGPGRRDDLSTGWGLRGISERVGLVGGEFSARQEGDTWVVRAILPRR